MMCLCQQHSDTLWGLCTILTISLPKLALSLTSLNMMLANNCVVCLDSTLNWAPSLHERARQGGGISPAMALSQTWNQCGENHRVYCADVLLTVVLLFDNRVGEFDCIMSPTTLD